MILPKIHSFNFITDEAIDKQPAWDSFTLARVQNSSYISAAFSWLGWQRVLPKRKNVRTILNPG